MSVIKPLHDLVVVERVAAEEKTASGIVLPTVAAEKPDLAIVIAVGPGKALENGNTANMSVKTGDKILLGKYTGQNVKFDHKEYIIVRESEILAIVS